MNEARIEISIQKRKNKEIPSELLKIAKLNERPKPIGVKVDNPTINLQQPNPSPFLRTDPSKPKMPDTGCHSASSGTFYGIIGTSTLSDMLRLKKENLDIQDYFNSGDIHKLLLREIPGKLCIPLQNCKKFSVLNVKDLPQKQNSLFRGSSPHASSSQNPMDNNEMLRSISSIKMEQIGQKLCGQYIPSHESPWVQHQYPRY